MNLKRDRNNLHMLRNKLLALTLEPGEPTMGYLLGMIWTFLRLRGGGLSYQKCHISGRCHGKEPSQANAIKPAQLGHTDAADGQLSL